MLEEEKGREQGRGRKALEKADLSFSSIFLSIFLCFIFGPWVSWRFVDHRSLSSVHSTMRIRCVLMHCIIHHGSINHFSVAIELGTERNGLYSEKNAMYLDSLIQVDLRLVGKCRQRQMLTLLGHTYARSIPTRAHGHASEIATVSANINGLCAKKENIFRKEHADNMRAPLCAGTSRKTKKTYMYVCKYICANQCLFCAGL